MLQSFRTDKFELERKGKDFFTIKKVDLGNSIVVPIEDIQDLISLLLKAEDEFR